MINSKAKGNRGEREAAKKLREYGYDVRRTVQYCGANHDGDLEGLAGVHLEIKRVERLNIYDAISQSRRDARQNELPVVMHRKHNCEWLVTMTLEDWIKLYREYEEML